MEGAHRYLQSLNRDSERSPRRLLVAGECGKMNVGSSGPTLLCNPLQRWAQGRCWWGHCGRAVGIDRRQQSQSNTESGPLVGRATVGFAGSFKSGSAP
eukprot:357993-Chlamydomonas_euryale.AAC.2